MTFIGTHPVKSKFVANNEIIEQLRHFSYLACNISFEYDNDIFKKLVRYGHIGYVGQLVDT